MSFVFFLVCRMSFPKNYSVETNTDFRKYLKFFRFDYRLTLGCIRNQCIYNYIGVSCQELYELLKHELYHKIWRLVLVWKILAFYTSVCFGRHGTQNTTFARDCWMCCSQSLVHNFSLLLIIVFTDIKEAFI